MLPSASSLKLPDVTVVAVAYGRIVRTGAWDLQVQVFSARKALGIDSLEHPLPPTFGVSLHKDWMPVKSVNFVLEVRGYWRTYVWIAHIWVN